jgi:Immunoglobulin I-set domain
MLSDFVVPPQINLTTSTSSNPQVIIGSTITIKCNVHGVPSPRIQWLLNNQALDTRNKRYKMLDNGYQLEIANTEISDSGRYTCIAKNEAGIVDRDFDLDVLGKFSSFTIILCFRICVNVQNVYQHVGSGSS